MTTVVLPAGTPTLGTTKLAACATIATLTAPKIATEISAAGSVEVGGYMYPAGWGPDGSTAKGSKQARLSSKKQSEQLNRTTYTLTDLQYVYDPQGLDTVPANKAKALLLEGTSIYLVERIGLDADTDWAVGQKVVVHYVRLGAQVKKGDRTDENGEFYIQQSLVYVNDGPVEGTLAA